MKRWLIAGSLALVSTTALADQSNGFFLGATGGNAKYDISQQDLDDVALFAISESDIVALNPTSSFDDSDTAWALFAGYRFTPYIAVEAGYMDLGSTKYRAESDVLLPGFGSFPSTIGVDISAKGPVLAAELGAPLGANFDLHTHLGAFFAKTSLDVSVDIGGIDEGESVSSNSQDFFAGAGVAYHFTNNLAASVDYTLFKDVGDENKTGEGDISSFGISLQYTFPQ